MLMSLISKLRRELTAVTQVNLLSLKMEVFLLLDSSSLALPDDRRKKGYYCSLTIESCLPDCELVRALHAKHSNGQMSNNPQIAIKVKVKCSTTCFATLLLSNKLHKSSVDVLCSVQLLSILPFHFGFFSCIKTCFRGLRLMSGPFFIL